MSKIAWARETGEDVEALVSMFVCRENPRAFRIRPSVGDGGVDVCVPVGRDHVEIYQVKKFASNLESGQKTQIVDSHARVQTYAAKRGWTIDKWHLVLPLDGTKENLEWLESEVEPNGAFPCVWKGLAYVEGWVSAYPDVVDYYLNNWGQRMASEIAQFIKLSGIRIGGPLETSEGEFAELTPQDAEPRLAALIDTLDRRDPHYTYEFSIGRTPPTNQEIAAVSSKDPAPAMIAVRSVGDAYVTFAVYARCIESHFERPITLKVSLVVNRDTAAHRELEDFWKYGRVPSQAFRAERLTLDVPGGFGDELTEANMRFLSSVTPGSDFQRRLSVLAPDGEALGEVIVTMEPMSANPGRTGTSNIGRDASGVLAVEFLHSLAATSSETEGSEVVFDANYRFSFGSAAGQYPDVVEPALAFILNLHPPNRFRVAAVRGTRSTTSDIPLLTRDADSDLYLGALLEYVRALIVVQKHTDAEIVVPEWDTEPIEDRRGVLVAAHLLKGGTLTSDWKRTTVEFPTDPEVDETVPFQLAFTTDVEAVVAGTKLVLGTQCVTAEAARVVGRETREDGTKIVSFAPVPGKTSLTRQLESVDNAPGMSPVDEST